MYQDAQNEHGCPLRFQTGQQSIKNFEAIISRLAPEQRAAFETERAERQDELESFMAAYGYNS